MPNPVLRWTLSSCGALPIQSPGRVEVANSNSQGIGGVHSLGRRWEFEQARDHMLDLLLFSATVADN